MFKNHPWIKPVALVLLAPGLAFCSAAAEDSSAYAQDSTTADPGVYIKMQLSNPIRMSKLRAGDVVAGSLSRDVYSAERKLFSSGSIVRLTVDHTEKRRRIRNDHWPWVVQAFTPRQETYPVFKNATVRQDSGESSVQVSLISASRMRDVHPTAKKRKSGQQSTPEYGPVTVNQSSSRKLATPTLVLEAFGIDNVGSAGNSLAEMNSAEPEPARPETLPAGTHCTILLLGNVSASKSKAGDIVRARLLEPVLLNSKVVVPAGSLFEGKVVKKTPPRWLSRAGSLYLTFTDLTLPGGNRLPVTASLAGAALDQRSHTRIDAEGQLHGERPGKAWMAMNLGVPAGISKEVDDGVQLVIEALVSAASDASTAGTARIVSSCVSGIYMATRHGRDVVLPRFTEMDISLDRPVSLNPGAEIRLSAVSLGGK